MLGVCKGLVRAVWCPVCHSAGGVQPGLNFISLWCQRPKLTPAWETIRLCGGFYGALSKVRVEVGAPETMTFVTYIHIKMATFTYCSQPHSKHLPTPLLIVK